MKISKFQKSIFFAFLFFYYQVDNKEFLSINTKIKSNNTFTFYKKLFRNALLENYVLFNSKKIGDDSHVMHVYETAVIKRKYNKEKLFSKEDY